MSGQPPPPPPPPNPASVTAPHFAPAGSTSTSTTTAATNTASAANHDPGQMSQTTAAAVATRGTPATLNLDDIFGDCFFTPEGDAVFMNDQPGAAAGGAAGGGSGGGSGSTGMGIDMDGSGIVGSAEAVPTRMASRPAAAAAATTDPAAAAAAGGEPQYQPVSYGGGIATTNLDNPNKSIRSTVMGRPAPTTAPAASANAGSSALSSSTSAASSANSGSIPPTKAVPFVQPPQQRHHLQYATPAMLGAAHQAQNAAQAHQASVTKRKSGGGVVHATGGAGGGSGGGGSGGGGRGERKMSDKQKVERRERNREHAKRSRIRKKFLLESLQQSVALLKDENDKLRSSIRQHLGDEADELLKKENLAEAAANGGGAGGLIAGSSADANKVLDDPDFSFIKALQTAQQNFVVTDPSLPDNPIVYATQGFLNLTGYTLDQVLGRNCRFLQGPETDPKAVEKIRRAIEEGSDMSVCLLNYRVDGSTFWNQFFIAALRDAAGNITNYVGVQCKVSDQYAANVCKRQEEADRATVAGSAADPPPGQSQPQGGMEAMGGDPQQQQQAAMAAPPAAPAAPPSAPAPVAASS